MLSQTALMRLPDEYEALRDEASRLALELADTAGEADASEQVHPATAEALRASGLCELTVPAAYGGRFESVDPLAITVVREALMAVSAHLDSLFGMQGIGSFALSSAGTDDLRAEWLPRVASLEAIAALAITEPDIGSDVRQIATTIDSEGDELVLSGTKAFITNAGAAAFFTVLGRDSDGLSLVLVPADADGVTVASGPRLIAPHIIGNISLDNVRVPQEHRIGAPGSGFQLALSTLAAFRVSVAGSAVGLAQAALEEAVRHTRSREQFGKPLSDIGAVSQLLARCWTEIEVARAFTYQAAMAARDDPLAALHLSSMAKVTASETAGAVVDRAVQVMGRFGLVNGSTIERLYRSARPLRIYEGASEVIFDSLARKLIKQVP
jgi:acyl-CoA dehydrogenase